MVTDDTTLRCRLIPGVHHLNGIEGSIAIDLHTALDSSGFVEMISSRPLHASKVLLGKRPEDVLSIIPLLFSVCGVAQTRAAFFCMQQQMHWNTDDQTEAFREMLVWSETAKEHLLRIFLDWPGLLDIEVRHDSLNYIANLVDTFKKVLFKTSQPFSPDAEGLADINAAYERVDDLEHYLENEVFCTSLSNWLSISHVADMQSWSQQAGSLAAQALSFIFKRGWSGQGVTTCQQLPELDADLLFERFSSDRVDEFIAKPQWAGSCRETGVFSRQFDQPLIRVLRVESGNGLLSRLTARLVELAKIPARLRLLLAGTADNRIFTSGAIRQSKTLGQVEAARGRLVHYVEFDQGRISDYRILAPTEWNFHPRGLITEALTKLRVENRSELNQLARMMINAVDPCVAYTLRIHDA